MPGRARAWPTAEESSSLARVAPVGWAFELVSIQHARTERRLGVVWFVVPGSRLEPTRKGVVGVVEGVDRIEPARQALVEQPVGVGLRAELVDDGLPLELGPGDVEPGHLSQEVGGVGGVEDRTHGVGEGGGEGVGHVAEGGRQVVGRQVAVAVARQESLRVGGEVGLGVLVAGQGPGEVEERGVVGVHGEDLWAWGAGEELVRRV
jgi:hypothetical protein